MPHRILSVDLGNTRCKLRWWEIAPPSAPNRLAALDLDRGATASELSSWLSALDGAGVAALSSVADVEQTRAIVRVLEARFPGDVLAPPEFDLVVECRPVESVGHDRVFAARGALERVQSACIVVDAGTALTVDALAVERSGDRRIGRFLGGAIAVGPALAAEALHAGTARLPRIDPVAHPAALGRDTQAALQAGVAVGFQGAARELVERIAGEAALGAAPVVVTGGARGFLLSPSAFGARTVVEEPELVHLGLIAASSARSRVP